MINSIEITITSLNKEIFVKIDHVNKMAITPYKTFHIKEDKINQLLRIIRTWKNNYLGNIIDGERFVIKIIYDNKEEIIKGNGDYPDNYLELKDFLEEYYD